MPFFMCFDTIVVLYIKVSFRFNTESFFQLSVFTGKSLRWRKVFLGEGVFKVGYSLRDLML